MFSGWNLCVGVQDVVRIEQSLDSFHQLDFLAIQHCLELISPDLSDAVFAGDNPACGSGDLIDSIS